MNIIAQIRDQIDYVVRRRVFFWQRMSLFNIKVRSVIHQLVFQIVCKENRNRMNYIQNQSLNKRNNEIMRSYEPV